MPSRLPALSLLLGLPFACATPAARPPAAVISSTVVIAAAASREWHEERFSGLYLEETLRGRSTVPTMSTGTIAASQNVGRVP